jgi:hypothetical protein
MATTRKPAKKKAPAKKMAPRADLGAPVDGFFKKPRAGELNAVLGALRKLVEETVPDASSSIKWGMPFYSVGGNMMAALGAHAAHVNLILSGPPGSFDDPEGRLEGEGKTGQHLKLRKVADIPREAVRGWLKTVARRARGK